MNRKRILDYGIRVGCLPTGPLDKITDVPGVTVGHATVRDARHHTGVTVIMPCEDNMFAKKLTAASFVLNGFGKTAGLVTALYKSIRRFFYNGITVISAVIDLIASFYVYTC